MDVAWMLHGCCMGCCMDVARPRHTPCCCFHVLFSVSVRVLCRNGPLLCPSGHLPKRSSAKAILCRSGPLPKRSSAETILSRSGPLPNKSSAETVLGRSGTLPKRSSAKALFRRSGLLLKRSSAEVVVCEIHERARFKHAIQTVTSERCARMC